MGKGSRRDHVFFGTQPLADFPCAEDGKQLDMDLDKVNIKDVVEQVNRHSRALERKEDLLG